MHGACFTLSFRNDSCSLRTTPSTTDSRRKSGNRRVARRPRVWHISCASRGRVQDQTPKASRNDPTETACRQDAGSAQAHVLTPAGLGPGRHRGREPRARSALQVTSALARTRMPVVFLRVIATTSRASQPSASRFAGRDSQLTAVPKKLRVSPGRLPTHQDDNCTVLEARAQGAVMLDRRDNCSGLSGNVD